MANEYFTETGDPATNTRLRSSLIRALFTAIGDAFDKLSGLSGNGGKLLRVNSGGTAQEAMSLGTSNQVVGMNAAGSAYEHKTIAGTSNQVTVTHGAGSVTLSAPQDLHAGASPTFNGMTLTSLTAGSATISGGSITNITDLAVADGGTGASTAIGARTNLGLVIGTDVQAYDADLAAVAGLSSNGMMARTGSGTAAVRTITAPAAGIAVSNGDGVSGNPTLALANDLSAVEGLSGTGFAARTGADTWAVRTITAPAAGMTISNGDGSGGNPTIALADDLAGLEAMSGTGMVVRTASNTYANRTITAGTGCTVSNGDGVSGNPTVSLIPGVGLGDVLGPGVAVDGELALYNGTTGQLIKRASTTGMLKATSGVLSAAVAGTDYQSPIGTISGIAKGNGANALTAAVAGTDYQAPLVSGTNIKTINGSSVLGSGDLSIATGIAATRATITTSTTLTNADAPYIPVAMTTLGLSITAPDATTLAVGAPKYFLDNRSGGYPFGWRDSTGTLIAAVKAGGTAYVSLESISTAAGVWNVTGDTEPGLITIDNTFSSTYASTVLKPFVALDNDKSIHFLALSSGFAAVAVDNATKAVGTPVTVDASASMAPKAVFKVSATTAIVFYDTGATNTNAVILSLSGATTLSVGTALAGWFPYIGEDFSGAPKIAQLSPTLYLASYTNGTNTSAAAASVSGTTITGGSPVNIITANSVANSTTTYALAATTGLVLYKSGAGAPYANNAVVISVSGTTCTVGTPAALTGCGSSAAGVPSSCLLSATKAIIADDNNVTTQMIACAVTISGTTVTAGTALTVETGLSTAYWIYTNSGATRYNPHLFPLSSSSALFWYLDNDTTSRVLVLSESGGTITPGTILYTSISAAVANGDLGGLPLNFGTTSFAAIRRGYAGAVGDAVVPHIVPHKISGTTVTEGLGKAPLGFPAVKTVATPTSALLPSGDYCLFPNANMGGDMVVFRTNGDAVNIRGNIGLPAFATSMNHPRATVSSNRIVLLCSTFATTVAAGTYRLRLLNVEIAA